jgi:hypothetical protein
MQILKILLYILLLPVFLYLFLVFEYLSFFSLILLLTVFLFWDLKKFNLFWFLILSSLLLDIAMHYWIGTYLISLTFVLAILFLLDRFLNNIFLNLIAVFVAFFVFSIFFKTFLSFQETSTLHVLELNVFLESLLFALKNIFVYLFFKIADYIFKSYFRGNVFRI